jgi:hypothetical protein
MTTYKITQCIRRENTYAFGINAQYLDKSKYIEVEVPRDSGTTEMDALRAAWALISDQVNAWQTEVAAKISNSFHVEDNGDSYTVGFSEQMLGASTFVQTIIQKNEAATFMDAISMAWTALEPQVTLWRTNVLSQQTLMGRHFKIQDNTPILEP